MRSFYLVLVLNFFFLNSIWAQGTLSDLHLYASEAVTEAGSFEAFVHHDGLMQGYYEKLIEYHGKDYLPKVSFETLLEQLRSLLIRVPELSDRLWPERTSEEKIEIHSIGISDGKTLLNEENWARHRETYLNGLRTHFDPVFLKMKRDEMRKQTLNVFSHLVPEIREFQISSSLSKIKKRDHQKFYLQLKEKPEFKAAISFYIWDGLISLRNKAFFQVKNADEFFYSLEEFVAHPEKLNPTFVLEKELHSFVREYLIKFNDLLSDASLVTKSHFPLRLNQTSWIFKEIPKAFHGIWKGIPLNECVGGGVNGLDCVSPMRWANVALLGNRLYYLEKNGRFAGYLHHIPIRSPLGAKYVSVDFQVPELATHLLMEENGHVFSLTLFEAWYRNGFSRLTEKNLEMVVNEESHISPAGMRYLRSTSYYQSECRVGVASDFETNDPIEDLIFRNFHQHVDGYDEGRMIYEATASLTSPLRKLVILEDDPILRSTKLRVDLDGELPHPNPEVPGPGLEDV